MKWILYIMLFITPAANVTNKDDLKCLKMKDVSQINAILACRPKFEARHVWSLQGTSQSEFSLFDTCLEMQDELVASSNVASTQTLRAWCFCEAENGKCPTNAQLKDLVKNIRECESGSTRVGAACEVNHTKKIEDALNQGSQKSSSIRLYPPPKD